MTPAGSGPVVEGALVWFSGLHTPLAGSRTQGIGEASDRVVNRGLWAHTGGVWNPG